MSGKGQVIAIGKKVISLIRQKCLLKYGSVLCNQKQARKLTQFEDLQRCFQSRMGLENFRIFKHVRQQKLQWFEHVKILTEIQAGNCGQMARLTYIILCKIVPPGIKVETRIQLNNCGSHQFVCLKPLSVTNQQETLVIDPWPSNQIINPEVVSHHDYFGDKQNQYKVEQYSKQPAQLSKERYMNFDFVKQNDFDLQFLNNVENMIDKKQYLDDPLWNLIRVVPSKMDIYDLMQNEQWWSTFRKQRLNIKSVRKNEK